MAKGEAPIRVRMIHNAMAPTPAKVAGRLAEHGIDFSEQECSSAEHVLSFARDADVVWIMGGSAVVTPDVLESLDRCWAILRTGAGTDNVPVDKATERGIVVAHTPEATTQAVAEHTLALLLAVVRQVAVKDRAIKDGVWEKASGERCSHLYGQTFGLVGFGRIAQAVARKLAGFEMTLIACDPVVDAQTMAKYDVVALDFEEVLQRSDYLSLHTPLTKQTYHLMGESQFQTMKSSAVLINTCRGKVIDEHALQLALSEGWIVAAGLDVVEQEPPDAENPLLYLDNVVATPHIAGSSDEAPFLFWDHSVRSLIALSQYHWPPWCANPNVTPKRTLLSE